MWVLLVGRGDREVRRVLVALDVSPDIAAEAAETGADLIVSHHPVMNIRWHAQQMQTLRGGYPAGRPADGVGEAGYLRRVYAHQSGCGGGRRQRLSGLHRWVCRIQNR